MKKTLAAVAILGAFAGSAMADVTIYGRVDTGFQYKNASIESATNPAECHKDKTFAMESGKYTGSRLGFKGSEKISDGLSAGFVLETGLTGDNGAGLSGFNRESSVHVAGDFGKLTLGKVHGIWTDSGSVAMFAANASVVGTGVIGIEGVNPFAHNADRLMNSVVYQTPVMGGFQAGVQYATNVADVAYDGDEDKYAAAVVTYKAGALAAGVALDTVLQHEGDDQQTFAAGATYDFGAAKVSLAAQYFKGANDIVKVVKTMNDNMLGDDFTVDNGEGYGVSAGVAVPAFGGTFTASATYVDGEGTMVLAGQGMDADLTYVNAGVVYTYKLSKNFMVYGGASYTKFEGEHEGKVFGEAETKLVSAGMVVYF